MICWFRDGVATGSEPAMRFLKTVLHSDGRRRDAAVRSMEPALFALAATCDGDLAAYCFMAACLWPPPDGESVPDAVGRASRAAAQGFFRLLASGAHAAGPASVATEGFFRVGLGFPRGLSEVLAAYAAKGLTTVRYPPPD
jgi:hypothetical protein